MHVRVIVCESLPLGLRPDHEGIHRPAYPPVIGPSSPGGSPSVPSPGRRSPRVVRPRVTGPLQPPVAEGGGRASRGGQAGQDLARQRHQHGASK